MKTNFILVLILLFSFDSYTQYRKWTWVNPYPTGEQINQIYFLDELYGFAIGNHGTLIRTTDSGANWQQADITADCYFKKIFFYDNLIGWVLGNSGGYGFSIPLFLKTTDGGETWKEYTITSQQIYLEDIFFLNNQIGWCIGQNNALLKTTDGGLTWDTKALSQTNGTIFTNIFFKNLSDGFVLGYNSNFYPFSFVVGYSNDGGNSWKFKYSPSSQNIINADMVADSLFVTISEYGLLHTSADNCESWTFRMNEMVENLYCVDFHNLLFAVAGADSGYIMRSFDGGINWDRINTGFNAKFNSIQAITENVLAASGHYEYSYSYIFPFLLTSSDQGLTWDNHVRQIETRINISGIAFLNSSTVFISGIMQDYPFTSYIYKTSDAGESWQQAYSLSNGSLFDIKNLNDKMFASGSENGKGVILMSEDGGWNWQKIIINTVNYIDGLSLPDSSAIYALREDAVLKSTDMGNTWGIIYQPSNPGFRDIEFISKDAGYVVGGDSPSKLYKTTNGGQSWNNYQIYANSTSYNICFLSEDTGYSCGFGVIYKTINGGISWSEIALQNVFPASDIEFTDEQNGWVIGDNGIYATTNGGLNWVQEFVRSDNSIFTFGMNKGIGLWAGGLDCKIIKYNGDLPTSIVSNQIENLPTEFALFQNYPNPFNPTTKIRYDVPASTKVSIKIYDVLGSEVVTLVDAVLPPGRYTSEWNAANYASGVYIYKIEAVTNGTQEANFVDTKKLILLR